MSERMRLKTHTYINTLSIASYLYPFILDRSSPYVRIHSVTTIVTAAVIHVLIRIVLKIAGWATSAE